MHRPIRSRMDVLRAIERRVDGTQTQHFRSGPQNREATTFVEMLRIGDQDWVPGPDTK